MASLIGLWRAELDEAKRFFTFRLYAHAVTMALGIPALFVDGNVAYVLAALALVSEATAWALRTAGSQRQQQGETGRRRDVLVQAYGATQEPIDVTDVQERFSQRARVAAAAHDDPSYYATTAEHGTQRLLEQLQESAFWSKHLYADARKRAAGLSGGLLALAVACLAVAMVVEADGARLAAARVVVVFLAFLIAADGASRVLAWSDAAKQASDVDRRLEKCSLDAVETLFAVWGDYSVATATAPPIPDPVYRRNKDRLEAAWAQRTQSASSDQSPPAST